MPEYTFYKIVSKDENIKDCYVGKTKKFKNRVRYHKNNCYNENTKCYNFKLYKFIRENGGWNNFNFIEIETNEYDHKDSAIRERELIEKFNATLNSHIPSRTMKEYLENNKEIKIEYFKEYYEKNAEKIKDKVKNYRENNRKIISEKQKEKITCKCGCEITKSNLSTHLKTKKHIKFLALTADII
jgi:hypothetical protein